MVTIDHIETDGVILYSPEDVGYLEDKEKARYERAFSLMKKINAFLKIEPLPYFAYVDNLQGFDFYSEEVSSIDAEAIPADDYGIDNSAILFNNDYEFEDEYLERILSHEMRHVWQFSNLPKDALKKNIHGKWEERFAEIDAVAFEMLYSKEVMKINIDEKFADRITEDVRKRMEEIKLGI